MFISYFDESWDQTQKKILVIAGFIGRYGEWEKIERRWQELLDKHGLAYYRANEAEGAYRQFDKPPFRTAAGMPFTGEQFKLLQAVKNEFFDAVTFGRISGAAVGIPIDSFNQVADTQEKRDKFDGTPYYICGHILMLVMLSEIRNVLNSKDLMVFRFDRQEEFDVEMVKVHAHLQTAYSDFRSMVGSICFEDKKKFLPLQVADTLAYECRTYLEKKIDDENAVPRPELQRLMDVRKIFKISLCENKCLQEYLDNYVEP